LLQVKRDGVVLVIIDDQGTFEIVELGIGSLILDLGCAKKRRGVRRVVRKEEALVHGRQRYHSSC
jgi:hypothetical protein